MWTKYWFRNFYLKLIFRYKRRLRCFKCEISLIHHIRNRHFLFQIGLDETDDVNILFSPTQKSKFPIQPTLHLQGRMSPCPLAQCDARTAIRLTTVRTSLPRPQNSCNSTLSQSIARGCLPWVPLDPSNSPRHRDKLQRISSRWMMWVDADQRRLTLKVPEKLQLYGTLCVLCGAYLRLWHVKS